MGNRRAGHFRCPQADKRRYNRAGALAEAAAARARFGDGDIQAYRCLERNHWHVGHASKAPPEKLRNAAGRVDG